MKTTPLIAALLLTFASIVPAAEEPLSLAVLGMDSAKDLAEEAEKITLLLGVHLSNEPSLQLVERQEIDQTLSEQELSLSGAIRPDAAAKIGHMIGAKVLVTGKLVKVGETRMAVAKVIGVETGRVVSLASEYAAGQGATAAAAELGEQILKTVAKPEAGLVAKEETWEQRIERLRKLLPQDKALPKVKVTIPEEHLTARVPDPAAQTEVQKLLQALGFTLVEDGTADYEVTGEAFSERGAQRGNFISCRARIEVKAKGTRDNEVWVDRHTTSAVDTAEHIAGKTALQKGGLAVGEQLVVQFLAKRIQ